MSLLMRSHLREKTGRNDPCPCGSGKKHKHCCLDSQPLSDESLWRRHHEASAQLTRELMRFADRNFGDDIEDAWCDFNMDNFPPPPDSSENQIFMPYFLYLWDPERPVPKRQPGEAGAVVREFMQAKAQLLSDLDRQFLKQAISQPLSFYEVVWCKPGERMALHDVLLGQDTQVIEHAATQMVRDGDLLYAQIWHEPAPAVMGFSAPLAIPPRWKADVIALRKKLRRKIARKKRGLTAEDLVHYEDDVREVYLEIRVALHTPPRLENTDGDPLVFHTLTFQIGSAAVAFEALAPLAWGFSKEDLLDKAKLDEHEAIRAVTFDWIKKGNRKHKSWDNTIMGHIRISGNTLTADVNSKERAEKLRSEIEKRLGILASHRNTTAQSPEELRKNCPPEKARSDGDGNGLLRDPEARQYFQEVVQKQVEGWIHEKVPILGGKTPLQAVCDPDGREIVESLLRDWERRFEKGRLTWRHPSEYQRRPAVAELRASGELTPGPHAHSFARWRDGRLARPAGR